MVEVEVGLPEKTYKGDPIYIHRVVMVAQSIPPRNDLILKLEGTNTRYSTIVPNVSKVLLIELIYQSAAIGSCLPSKVYALA